MSGEDTPRSYVRRGYASILYQERTHPMSGEDSEHPSMLVRRGYTLILYVRRGHTSILHCMAMGENNSIPKWLIGLKGKTTRRKFVVCKHGKQTNIPRV